MGDFNAHNGTDIETWKGVIGRHEVPGLNENWSMGGGQWPPLDFQTWYKYSR